MEKQKAIELAYGSKFSTVFPWVDENGKFNLRARKLVEIDDLMKDFTKNDMIQELVNGQLETFIRPKSLQGIEDNNGWIKIESEDEIEIEKGFYWVNDFEFGGDIAYFDGKEFYCQDNVKQYPTHYQPIIKPKPPIY